MTYSRALSMAVLAIGAVLYFRRPPEEPIRTVEAPSPPPVAPPRDEAVKSELAVLRAELAAVRQEIAAKPAPQPEAVKAQATEADAEADRQERMAAIESAFRAEPVGGRWASTTGLAVREALNDSGLAARDLECRARTCRVELADVASADQASSLTRFVMRVAAILPSTSAQQIGEGRTLLYLFAGG